MLCKCWCVCSCNDNKYFTCIAGNSTSFLDLLFGCNSEKVDTSRSRRKISVLLLNFSVKFICFFSFENAFKWNKRPLEFFLFFFFFQLDDSSQFTSSPTGGGADLFLFVLRWLGVPCCKGIAWLCFVEGMDWIHEVGLPFNAYCDD